VVGVSPLRYRRCIALGGFIVPYMFLFSHELLLIFEEGQNQWLAGILAFLTACVGITVLGVAVVGFLDRKLDWWVRILLGATGLLLLNSEYWTDVLGVVVVAQSSCGSGGPGRGPAGGPNRTRDPWEPRRASLRVRVPPQRR
jgi:TRAP-type uncharacterized transport system fused permease subunit